MGRAATARLRLHRLTNQSNLPNAMKVAERAHRRRCDRDERQEADESADQHRVTQPEPSGERTADRSSERKGTRPGSRSEAHHASLQVVWDEGLADARGGDAVQRTPEVLERPADR